MGQAECLRIQQRGVEERRAWREEGAVGDARPEKSPADELSF